MKASVFTSKEWKKIISCLVLVMGIWGGAACFPPEAQAQNLFTFESCIGNTEGEGHCKDCCDCLDADAATRKECRDSCAVHDFSLNSDFIAVNAPSTLGPDGDYSSCVEAGDEGTCKDCCDGSSRLACGDRRFCRDACNAAYSGETPPPADSPPNNEEPPQAGSMTIEQTLSDEAQRSTIAFDGLAFLTGDLCSDSFLPPGKVADFSGFQYLRDNDPTQLGHNTDFVTIIAFNILNILNDDQVRELVTLAETQVSMINDHGYNRFPLMKAFRRLLEGDLPQGKTGLDENAVMDYSAELYRLDGQISYGRAKVLGAILRSLNADQKAQLDGLKALNGVGNWDNTLEDPLRGFNLMHDENVAVMTYASEMYSWYAGSVEADAYFCPERQGTYFGSFYMKDMPAMGNPDFTIDSNLTANLGNDFLDTLTDSQKEQVTGLVDIQRSALNEIVETRRAISAELRRFMTEDSVDEESVLSLAEKYGRLDGEIVYRYATHFAQVGGAVTAEQMERLTAIREGWNAIPCSGAYLYSEPIDMPEIMNTDFLFGVENGNEPNSDILVVDGETGGSVMDVSYDSGKQVRVMPMVEAGRKIWVLLEAIDLLPGMIFARASDAVCRDRKRCVFLFKDGGGVVPDASSYYYADPSPFEKLDFTLGNLSGLGAVRITTLKGASPENLETIQIITLRPM